MSHPIPSWAVGTKAWLSTFNNLTSVGWPEHVAFPFAELAAEDARYFAPHVAPWRRTDHTPEPNQYP